MIANSSLITRNGRTFHFAPGVDINFEVHGDGPSVLLLHGFGASLESWRDIEPILTRHFRLYLLDLKGCGLSTRPDDGAYALENQAQIVAAFIEELQLKNLVIIGHSYGGAVTFLTYLRLKDNCQGERVSALVLIDAAGYLQRFPFFISSLRIPVVSFLLTNLLPVTWQVQFTLRNVFYDSSKVTKNLARRYSQFLALPGSRRALISIARAILPDDPDSVIRRIPEITVPTLILWGRNDPAIPLKYACRFHGQITGSDLRVIPECGHIPHEEKPSAAAELIMNFLGRQRRRDNGI